MLIKKAVAFLFGICLLVLMGVPVESTAAVNIDVGISIPPPPLFRFHAPPPVFVIPGTYIYAVPDIDVDILFYHGYWYRPHGGHWFRSRLYNGPWAYLDTYNVPRPLFDLPHEYYRIPPGHRKIPYGHFKNNWGRWERERYWEHDARWREGRHRGYDGYRDKHGGPHPGPSGPPPSRGRQPGPPHR